MFNKWNKIMKNCFSTNTTSYNRRSNGSSSNSSSSNNSTKQFLPGVSTTKLRTLYQTEFISP